MSECENKNCYLRYDPPVSHPQGTFRGEVPGLYEGTMQLIHEQALVENERRNAT